MSEKTPIRFGQDEKFSIVINEFTHGSTMLFGKFQFILFGFEIGNDCFAPLGPVFHSLGFFLKDINALNSVGLYDRTAEETFSEIEEKYFKFDPEKDDYDESVQMLEKLILCPIGATSEFFDGWQVFVLPNADETICKVIFKDVEEQIRVGLIESRHFIGACQQFLDWFKIEDSKLERQ